MDWQLPFSIVVVVLTLGLLAFSRYGADLIMLGAMTLLVVTGILKPKDALAGFANEGMITVGIFYVVAAGLSETGAISLLAERLLGRPKSLRTALARMLLPTAFLSAFINNTPQVAMMLPVVKDWARRIGISPSKLLIPLSYATILGGMCTLIGTSTNLIVSGLVVAQNAPDLPPLKMFDQTPVGIPCALVGLTYVLFCSRWLPDRRPVTSELGDPRQYTVEMLVEPGSALVGKTIEGAGLRSLPGLYLMEIDRGGEVLAAVGSRERLHANDRLVFVGVVESVVYLQKMRSLKLATDQVFKINAPRSERCLVEVVISDSFPQLGMSIREGRFRTMYNAAIIAVARNGARLTGKIGDIVLQSGDTLLLETHPTFVDQHRNSRDFFLVSPLDDSHHRPSPVQAWIALGVLAVMVLVAGLGLLSMFQAALLAASAMLLTRCCPENVARKSIDWQVLVVIAASLALGRGLQTTGAAGFIAHQVLDLGGSNPWIALAIVYLITSIFTEVLSHSAAAALVFPIALTTARTLGVNPMPFIMVLMIAASCSFATPTGYQTNLMVYGPGGYRFSDYLRFGGPLNVLIGIAAVLITPWIYPF